MNKGFVRLKNKFRRSAILKSLLLGLSLGILAAAVIATVMKRNAVSPELLICLSAGVGVASVFGLIAFLIMRPTDRSLAKKLDTALALDEKVQTMVAFRNVPGEMTEIQREDTERRLSEVPSKQVKTGRAWLHFLAPLLACTMLTVAIVTPLKATEPEPQPVDPGFVFSDWQRTALAQLIEEVKKSDMEETPRQVVVGELEGLLAALDGVDKVGVMKQLVVASIVNISKTVDEANTYEEIGDALGDALPESLQLVGKSIESVNGSSVRADLDTMKAGITDDMLSTLPGELSGGIRTALFASSVTDDDVLYVAIEAFATALETVHDQLPSYTVNWAKGELDQAFSEAAESINKALLIQHTNDEVGDKTIRRLMEIFGISSDDLPEDLKNSGKGEDGEYDEPDDDDKPLEDGGGVSADVVYGSNDEIFDPARGEHIAYGEPLTTDYYPRVSEKILGGNLSEELEDFINDYFSSLFNGSKTEE